MVRVHAVRLLDRDPDLLGTLPRDQAEQLRRRVTARAASVPAGRCKPALYSLQPHAPVGLLILDGFLLRRVCVESRRSIEVLGPHDISKPWIEGEDYSLPVEVEWPAATALH
jgi:hypothetical protein